jgi:hypothetical protein
MISAAQIYVARIRMVRICFLKVDQIENFELCTGFSGSQNVETCSEQKRSKLTSIYCLHKLSHCQNF